MVTLDTFRNLALSFPEAAEEPHFEKVSFRVKKKIFATYNSQSKIACIKLSEIEQSVFASPNQDIISAVDNKWGKQGWTFVDLNRVNSDLFVDALTSAYCGTAPKKLANHVRPFDIEQ
jgi:predicted DNA-binding protein (MmcQ/YjbR family)